MTEAIDADELSGCFLAGMSSTEIVDRMSLTATPAELQRAMAKAVIRAKQDQMLRIEQAVRGIDRAPIKTESMDQTIDRGMFLLRTFQA